MQRRTFFQSIGSGLALTLAPRWARARLAGAGASQDVGLQDVALVVLPQSLGPKRIPEVAAAFEQWLQGYQEGADAGYGYGKTHLAVTGPNPSLHYADQLKQLDAAASAKGGRFAALGDQDKRAILQAALLQAGVTSIPRRPNGRHVASDLMSYFYSSSDGIDFRYNAEIREKDCRGLASSTKRPAPLS
jgi:hypothetical protein